MYVLRWISEPAPRTVLHATRILRGLTQTELAKAVGVSQSTISKLESGGQRPDPDLADAAAAALGIPVELLGHPAPAPRLGHVLKASLARTVRNQFLAGVTMTHVHVGLLLNARAADIAREPGGNDHPHHFAERLRRRWSLPAGPVTGLIPMLEAHGVICVYRDLSPLGERALASTTENGQTLLLLDIYATRTELAWAITHELGHLVFGSDPSKREESDADAFAAAFLTPGREVVDDDTLRVGLNLEVSAAEWGVQPRALAQRLLDLGVITHLDFRARVHEAQSIANSEGRTSLLGSPAALADAVRSRGGSTATGPGAFLAVESLRMDYLTRSGR